MYTSKLLIAPAIIAATTFAGTSFAYGGGHGPNHNSEVRAQMQEIFANKDFSAWKELIGERPGRKRILEVVDNQEKFEKLIELHNARKNRDHETAKPLHEELGLKMKHRGKGERLRDKVERVVNNIDNGIEIVVTSDDPEIVAKLQSRKGRSPRNEVITRTKVNLENGIKITVTADDEELVEKIQKRKDHKRKRGGRRGFGKRHFQSQD